jgi:beta-glucosidase
MTLLFRFPKAFHWGSATSAHQVEGGNRNDWTSWERSPDRQKQLRQRGLDPADFVSGPACDFWNHYEADLDIAQSLGHTMFRMSVEWSRVEPEEGVFDEDAIARYRDIIAAVRARGMEPMVTLWHFTNPLWLTKQGGMFAVDAAEHFERYALKMLHALPSVTWWVTFNEATTVYAWLAYRGGQWPPQQSNVMAMLRFRRRIARAHVRVYHALKRVRPDVRVGAVENNRAIIAGPFFKILGIPRLMRWAWNHWLWRTVGDAQDFLGLNYYITWHLPGGRKVTGSLPRAEEMDWEIWPPGLYQVLKEAALFHKPIFITENGVADGIDTLRAGFIRDHVACMAKAMHEGVDVRGYLYWSLLDNFEWSRGFGPRFGLVAVDYRTQARTVRPSAWEYARIIRNHAVDIPSGALVSDNGRRRTGR